MLVFKEKHIKYGFTHDNSYVFIKGQHKGQTYNGPIMNYFKKTFAGEKMTAAVAKWDALVPTSEDKQAHIDYDNLKPKYSNDFNFPNDNPQEVTDKEIEDRLKMGK